MSRIRWASSYFSCSPSARTYCVSQAVRVGLLGLLGRVEEALTGGGRIVEVPEGSWVDHAAILPRRAGSRQKVSSSTMPAPISITSTRRRSASSSAPVGQDAQELGEPEGGAPLRHHVVVGPPDRADPGGAPTVVRVLELPAEAAGVQGDVLDRATGRRQRVGPRRAPRSQRRARAIRSKWGSETRPTNAVRHSTGPLKNAAASTQVPICGR